MLRIGLRKKEKTAGYRAVYDFFGAILQLLKDPTVSRYWAKLTGIGCRK